MYYVSQDKGAIWWIIQYGWWIPTTYQRHSNLTSEALYQACRFPHKQDIQKLIIGQASPMTAKMVSKPHRKYFTLRLGYSPVQIMHWCLRVKLAQHWETFGELLLSTGERPIVEESYRDQFSGAKPTNTKKLRGAKPTNTETLIGKNVLGKLLNRIAGRTEKPRRNISQPVVEPPTLHDFLLIEKPIGVIEGPRPKSKPEQLTLI